MRREPVERLAERPVVREARGAIEKPPIEAALGRRQLRTQLGLKSRRIADQVARVNLEEFREQLPRCVREMRPRAVFNQGQVRLTDALVQLGLDGADNFYLRQLAVEPPQLTFEVTQHPELLPESH